MFAKTVYSTQTPVAETKFTGLTALSFNDAIKTVSSKFAYQNVYADSDFTGTNRTDNGKGLVTFIKTATERIFVKRRMNQWRLSKLS